MLAKDGWRAGYDDSRHRSNHRNGYRGGAPSPETFAKGCDFAARSGLAPKRAFTSGKQKPSAISRIEERTLSDCYHRRQRGRASDEQTCDQYNGASGRGPIRSRCCRTSRGASLGPMIAG